MPTVSFDQTLPDALPRPRRGQVDYWDDASPGFGLRVSQGGSKTWVMMVHDGLRKRRITVGAYPALSLGEARSYHSALLRGLGTPGVAMGNVPARRRPGRPRRDRWGAEGHAPALPTPGPLALRSASFFDDAPIPMVVVEDGRIRHLNAAALGALGALGPEMLANQPFVSLVLPAERNRFNERFASGAVAGGTDVPRHRLRLVRLDGTSFPAELVARVVDGQALEIAFLDLTERDRAFDELRGVIERTEATNRAKTEFLATMSHELRTPLSAIMGTLRLIEGSRLDEEQRRYTTTALQAATSLLSILNDTLDLSKVEAGKLELREESFEVRPLTESIVSLFGASAREKGIRLALSIGPATPRVVYGDAGRLRQVLLNLVSNAIKFTEVGEVVLGVAPVENAGGRVSLRFEVLDTGIGIAPEDRTRVFEAFSQLDSAASRQQIGTGLGLAICQRLVRLMGSEIEVESEPGKGSCFHFTLSLRAEEPGTVALPRHGVAVPRPEGTERARVLVCEDDRVTRMLMVAMLDHAPYDVEVVDNGRDAVARVRDGRVDVVLMDVSMPEFDGVDATRAIRALDGAAGRVPIVALTGHAMTGDRERFLAAGMNAYLVKPVDRRLLRETIEGLLERADDVSIGAAKTTEP